MTNERDLPPPFLLRRLAAIIYDALLVLPLIMAAVAVVMAIHTGIAGTPPEGTEVQLNPYLVRLVAVLTVMIFYCWFWLKSGQTLGMQAWRIKLISLSGAPLTLSQAVRRCVGATLSAAALGLGYLWCLFDRNGRYWHDYLSDTALVLLPKTEKKKKGKTSGG